jgi:hypothetical protein
LAPRVQPRAHVRVLLCLGLLAVGCCDTGRPNECDTSPAVASAQGTPRDFVINQFLLPQQRSDFAIDLNCDGATDNQLGAILSALDSQSLDEQPSLNAQVASGQSVQLIRWVTDDPQQSDHAGVSVRVGKPTAKTPDFSGMGQFTVDDSFASADFLGRSSAGVFKSNHPPIPAPDYTLLLPLFDAIIALPVFAAHIQFTDGTDAASGAPGLLDGQLHGAVRATDFADAISGPAAAFFTAVIHRNPDGNSNLEAWFDGGGCSDGGVPAVAGDRVITRCEVLASPIARNLLAPDVALLDADGHYAPDSLNLGKESISLGLGFTAVQASF